MRKVFRAILVVTLLSFGTYTFIRRVIIEQGMASQLQLNLALKRLFDVFVSTIALTVLSPVFLLISIGIRLTSPGPIFYMATRIGRNARPFRIFKFRTMVVHADKLGPGITGHNDARVTAIGRLLRKSKLDEIPQLINVLRGDMSLVGPRPEDPRFVKMYTPEQSQILAVKPGITSPASVQFRDEESLLSGADWESKYVTEVMPTKLQIDMEYVKDPNIGRDLKILVQTVQAVFN